MKLLESINDNSVQLRKELLITVLSENSQLLLVDDFSTF